MSVKTAALEKCSMFSDMMANIFFISVATQYYFRYGFNLFFLEIKNVFLSSKLLMLFRYELNIG